MFAVYHNLACLIAAEAAEVVDESRRSTMFRLALLYSKRNEAYCRQYGIGHDSVLTSCCKLACIENLATGLLLCTKPQRQSGWHWIPRTTLMP